MSILTPRDVENLTRDPSGVSRIATASKLAADFNSGSFTQAELGLAVEIFRIMLKDAEVRVRSALSQNLKSNAAIPRDVAKALAADVDLVALPMLENSPVLTADDLVEIIVTQRSIAKMTATARRAKVEPPVTAALVMYGDETVASVLVRNVGAAFTEPAYDRLLDRFGSLNEVADPLIDRDRLPVRIAERLTAFVSDHLRERLIARHRLDAGTAMELVLATRERATVDLAKGYSETSVATLVGQLLLTNRLTPSLVLRAICVGHRAFFEHALGRRAGLPLSNVLIMLRESQSFERLWARAGMPAGLLPAAIAAYQAIVEIECEGRDLAADDFSRRIIERVMTQYELFGVEIANDDLEYLFTKAAAMGTLPRKAQ